jgi:hypothetical protein
MTKIAEYRVLLENTADWFAFLKKNSNLPGPRGNLELAQAAAQLGQTAFFETCLDWDANHAPENTPECFVYFCGVLPLCIIHKRGKPVLKSWSLTQTPMFVGSLKRTLKRNDLNV